MKAAEPSGASRSREADTLVSIPSSWYLDPAHLIREQDGIFRRTWHWVGRADELSNAGDYLTCDVAGEPVIVARGEDGRLRAFSNVCLHRAGPVARDQGNTRLFRCSYHGWNYGLDGRVRATPGYDGLRGEDGCLPQLRVETWDPFVFVNLDPDAQSLLDTLGELRDRFGAYGLPDLTFRREVVLEADCNWKVVEENARECYHCPLVHPSFTAAYDVQNAVTETFDVGSLLRIEQRERSLAGKGRESLVELTRDIAEFRRQSPALPGLEGEETTRLYFVYPFPGFMFTLAPEHMSASRIVPVGVDRVRWVRQFFFESGTPQAIVDRNVEFRTLNMREDLSICEAVQRGLRSRFYGSHRYSPKEPAVYHFHAVVTRMLQ